MNKSRSFIFTLIMTAALIVPSLPAFAWDLGCDFCQPLDISVEVRTAYYHPSSSKVRRIYGDGWADYQLEISKGIYCDWKVWMGVSGFSRKGDSIGFHDETKLRLIPVYFGVKYEFPCFDSFKLFVGGAGCYSFLRIEDHSDYVHRHTNKEEWGGLIQSGLTYQFWECAYVSFFLDYFFQEFSFRTSHHHSSRSGSGHYEHSGYVERNNLDMSGYKVGVGLGYTF